MAEVGAMSIDEKDGKLHVQNATKAKLAEKENSVSHDIPGVVATDEERETAEIGE